MFTEEEKAQAKHVKYSLYPQGELEQYLNPRFLPVIDETTLIDATEVLSINIPKQIVLFWHNEILPNDVQTSIDKIKQYNQGYQIELFHTETAGEFIKQYYGQELYELYQRRCIHPSMKSDLFRMCYLAQKGGVYVDIDINCYNSLEEIFKSYQFDCFLFYSIGKPCCIDNDFIVCKPNNRIILAIIDKIKEHLTKEYHFTNVWACTGPGPVSKVVLEFLMQDILQDKKNSYLQGLLLGQHGLAGRSYGHAELAYKETREGNWRYFRLPRNLHQL